MKSSFLLWLVIIAVCVGSCTAYRKLIDDKKDKKAVVRVMSDPILTDQVYNYALGSHPFDYTPIVIKGKDSIVYKPVPFDVVRDSIIKEKCPALNIDSLKKIYTSVVEHWHTPDIIIQKDTNTIQELVMAQFAFSNLQGQFTQQKSEIAATKKSKNKLMWWLIGACAFIVIENGLLIWSKVKV